MCYNISQEDRLDRLIRRYNRTGLTIADFKPQVYVNGFDSPLIPILKTENKTEIDFGRWGFVPSHIKSDADAKKFKTDYVTLNAKSETVFQLPTYKGSVVPRRCIIPVCGFFEHHHLNAKEKIPFFIHLKNEEIFSLAGIYNYYKNEFGEQKCTVSILTTEANPLMAFVHNIKKRQPLIIDKQLEEVWLDPALSEPQIKDLMQVYPDTNMEAYTINKINPKSVDVFDKGILNKKLYDNLII